MKCGFLYLVCFVQTFNLFAQNKADNWWYSGFYGNIYQKLSFDDYKIKIDTIGIRRTSDLCNSSLSDSLGNLLYFSNGLRVYNRKFETMENGDSLNPGNLYQYFSIGYPVISGVIGFFRPNSNNQIIDLIHQESNFNTKDIAYSFCRKTYTTVIDISANAGLGKVISKNKLIGSHLVKDDGMAACRHGNGRDWWIVSIGLDTNELMVYLLDPKGIRFHHKDVLKFKIGCGFAQSVFSPNGKVWVHHYWGNSLGRSNSQYEFNEVQIFDFDRCTGHFSNQIYFRFYVKDLYSTTGCSISPNSQFLYISANYKLFQYDLAASDIQASEILINEFDKNDSTRNRFLPNYFLSQLAPDGKIYLCGNHSISHMPVINFPNRRGAACGFDPAGLPLYIFNQANMQYFPNYKLGPMDYSICDTLGLDDVPVANFTSHQDKHEYLKFEFRDLSSNEIDEWSWDFGDGSTSNEDNPMHTFSKNGTYTVCLTVKNEFGMDSKCEIINIGMTDIELLKKDKIIVFPNPLHSFALIQLSDFFPENLILKIHDINGVEKGSHQLQHGLSRVELSHLISGVYYFSFYNDDVFLYSEKMIIETSE